jgi:4-carboxymuconolactone decarboxylase
MSETTVPTASIEDLRAEVLLDVSPTVATVVPDLNKLARNFALGEIWPRTGLSQRDRSIATIAALVALSCTEELRLHTLRGLANGISKEEFGEILTQLIPYVGFPLVVSAATKIADLIERAHVHESRDSASS